MPLDAVYRQLADLTARLEAVEAKQAEPAPGPDSGPVDDLRTRVERLEADRAGAKQPRPRATARPAEDAAGH